jgi:hypothetical protein
MTLEYMKYLAALGRAMVGVGDHRRRSSGRRARARPRRKKRPPEVVILRSLLFVVWLYLSMALFAVGLSPALLMPYRRRCG